MQQCQPTTDKTKLQTLLLPGLLPALLLGLLLTGCEQPPATDNPYQPLCIQTTDGQRHHFQIELADTPQKQALGLMYRTELDADHGMLFDFGDSRTRDMWMKNTFISLDMLFINTHGTIVHIAHNTRPLSEQNITSGQPVRAVLELAGGTAEKNQITRNAQIIHPLFGNHCTEP